MTDGRIPGKWVSEPRFAEMPDATFGFLARAIAWSNEAGTDGHVKRRYLAQLHSTGEQQPHVYEELEDAGLWRPAPDGYQFIDWDKKAHQGGMGQELAENVRSYKQRKKANQQKYRDSKTQPSAVTGHVTAFVADHVGQVQDTTGKDRLITEEVIENDFETESEESFAPCCGEVHGPFDPCPRDHVRDAPKTLGLPDPGYCGECGLTLTSGVCLRCLKKERAA